MKTLFLCACLLSGCAAQTPAFTALPALPPFDARPLQAQFGLRFTCADFSVPLQGAVQAAEHEAGLGLIFPHGRTLGVCRYGQGGMECVPAGEERAGTRFMLHRIGLALYRLLPALSREPLEPRESVPDVTEADWSVRWQEADTGRSAEYRDLAAQVTMDIRFTEITRP